MEKTCRKELVKKVAEELGMTQSNVAAVVACFFEQIKKSVISGRRVTIARFGVFRLHTTPARKRFKCPANGQEQDIPARQSLRFKQSAEVRRKLNKSDEDDRA